MKKFLAGIFAFLFGVYKYSESMAICYDEGNPIASYVSSSSSCNSGYEGFGGWSVWCDQSTGNSVNGYLCVSTSALYACGSSGGDVGLSGGSYLPYCNCATTGWVSNGAGYERNTSYTATGAGTCTYTNSYRCAPYYYGSTGNGYSGCYACPGATSTPGINGGSVAGPVAGNGYSITSCYISGAYGSDSTGVWSASGSCPYTL